MTRSLLILFLSITRPVLLLGQVATDTTITHAEEVMSFEDAGAMAVDPLAHLYVVDTGNETIFQLSLDGDLLQSLGGPGSGEGQFDEPADIDPTNGLTLYVADAGNGRIQRFSKNFAFLGALPVDEIDIHTDRGLRPTYRRYDDETSLPGAGRPIAVAAAGDDELFVIDGQHQHVLKWDHDRRLAQVIGGFGEGEGMLVDPVALAVQPGTTLYVADRTRQAVVVFDLFGNYIRLLAQGLAGEVAALLVVGQDLWIVCSNRLLIYERGRRLSRVMQVQLDRPLVDVAVADRYLFLLTVATLYRVPLPSL